MGIRVKHIEEVLFNNQYENKHYLALLIFVSNSDKAKQKNMCVSGYMLLKIRVGRSDYFFIFWNNFICLKYFLWKQNWYIYIFQPVTWCHGSLLLHFHWLTYLISADVLSAACEGYKKTLLVKLIFYKLQQKQTWNWKHLFCEKN